MIIKTLVKDASKLLKNNMINSYMLDAEVILSSLLNVSKEYIQVNDNLDISDNIIKKYNSAINRRIKKEPVAYILNKKEFWSKNFYVNKHTLIPRPETELLIYEIIKIFKNKNINILDVGTGSGCILIALLLELKKSRGVGIDLSPKAIKIARANAKTHEISNRAIFKNFSIEDYIYGQYDLVISNPPYVKMRKIRNLSSEVSNYEPYMALNGGIDGLDLIKKVIYKSLTLLKRDGILAIEIDNNQYLKVSKLLLDNGFRKIRKVNDLYKNIRCIISTKI